MLGMFGRKKPKKTHYATHKQLQAVDNRVTTVIKEQVLDETSSRSLRDRVASLERRIDDLTERVAELESLIIHGSN